MKLWEAFKAASEGKEVEWREPEHDWRSIDCDTSFSLLDANDLEFRLKPEPVKPFETWAVVFDDGSSEAYIQKEWAIDIANKCQGRVVLLREVINE